MEKLLIAVCLALAALSVGALPVEPEEQKATHEAVDLITESKNEPSSVTSEEQRVTGETAELDSETAKQILEDYLRLPTPLGVEYITSPRYQIISCADWFEHENDHIERFAAYEDGNNANAVHKSMLELDMSEVQRKLYERRRKGDKLCYEVYENRTKEVGSDEWDLPDEPPFDETLSVEDCAENHLKDSQAFKLPVEFKAWSRDEQADYCEEAQVSSIKLSIEGCDYQYRKLDYLKIYSKEQNKTYNEITRGFRDCETLLDWGVEWLDEELPSKESAEGEPNNEESV